MNSKRSSVAGTMPPCLGVQRCSAALDEPPGISQQISDYAKRYVEDRFGTRKDYGNDDRWFEHMGLVCDAYDELLNVYLKDEPQRTQRTQRK